MKSRSVIFGVFAILLLLSATFASGVLVGTSLPSPASDRQGLLSFLVSGINNSFLPTDSQRIADDAAAAGSPVGLETTFRSFWRAWEIVHDEYVSQPVDDQTLVQGAIEGMLDSLDDPYTAYMDPTTFEQFNTRFQGEYSGIGVLVDITADYLTVISAFPGSPAEKAGLKTGDQIVGVDGEDVTGMEGNLVIRKILGPVGTQVTLTVLRDSETEPFDVELTRESIYVPSVESQLLDDGIGYIHLNQFGDSSSQEVRDAIDTLLKEGAKGLIFDVRNNGGGLLNTAIDVSSEFIGNGVILYEQFSDGSLEVHEAVPGGLATDLPMVLLVNEGSASASEILAGAIQDHGRGMVVGTTTYGKGTVQKTIPLSEAKDAIRVTVARWLTPNKKQISQVGITPDIVVSITDQDQATNHDSQLDAAIETLKSEISSVAQEN